MPRLRFYLFEGTITLGSNSVYVRDGEADVPEPFASELKRQGLAWDVPPPPPPPKPPKEEKREKEAEQEKSVMEKESVAEPPIRPKRAKRRRRKKVNEIKKIETDSKKMEVNKS